MRMWLPAILLLMPAGNAVHGDEPKPAVPPPDVETRLASSLGATGMTVNGSIQPHGLPTTYFFEYGPTTAYAKKTRPAALPPRLAAFYRESWDDNAGGWYGDLSGRGLAHHPSGGASGGFVRFTEPAGHDYNHVDSIGVVHLAKYIYPGPWGALVAKLSLQLAAGDPDFRDARISIHVRGVGWQANGSELQWWTQSQSNIGDTKSVFRNANWAYTGFSLADRLASGKWEKVDYRLRNDTEDWTYAGNNRAQQRFERYSYWSIGRAQEHLNCDFFHMVTFVDPANPPRGSIDFDELQIAYRNHSLVLPSNGGKLLRAPKSVDDPATLTDGWRHGRGKTWRGPANPSGPVEIVYAFADPVTIRALQLHQNPEWPTREAEVLVSKDDRTYTPVATMVLPEKGAPNANFAFGLKQGLAAEAEYLKVQLASGYKKEHRGLGEIEVFGSGATMQTDDDLYFVNLDLLDFKPGETIHYRLVAENRAGTTRGADRAFTIPADARPTARTDRAVRITSTSAQVQGRLQAMGWRTQFHFEYGPDSGYAMKTPPTYGGLEITPRLAFANLAGLKPGTKYHYRLVAVNEKGAGVGAGTTFQTGDR